MRHRQSCLPGAQLCPSPDHRLFPERDRVRKTRVGLRQAAPLGGTRRLSQDACDVVRRAVRQLQFVPTRTRRWRKAFGLPNGMPRITAANMTNANLPRELASCPGRGQSPILGKLFGTRRTWVRADFLHVQASFWEGDRIAHDRAEMTVAIARLCTIAPPISSGLGPP